MDELSIQNNIRIELSKMGFTVFRVNVGRVRMADGRWFDTQLPRGFSDIFAIKSGRVYFFEVKGKGGKPSLEQLNFIDQMRKKGCVAGVVWNMEDVRQILKEGEQCIVNGEV